MNPTLSPRISSRDKQDAFPGLIRSWRYSKPLVISLFFAAHLPLGVLMARWPIIATAHAFATLLVGLWVAGSWAKPQQVACIGGYVTGAETLWRMTGAAVFWEFGKYALITILLIAIVRSGRLRGPLWPLFYFLLMLPSLVLPMTHVDSSELRNQVSFNLSGPLALAVSTWYFSSLELTREQIRKVFLALSGPIIGVSAIALFDTLGASNIYFSNNSNFITSGGFGPNQVSAALALGALLVFLLILDPKSTRGVRVILLMVLVILSAQSALTFSRGGLYAAGGAAAIAVFYLIRLPRTRLKVFSGVLALLLLANFVVLPQLDVFTDGALSRRFINTKLTGRDKLVRADLRAWSENPLFGVGPGQAKMYRQGFRADASAHTEFSRMLAEHGIFGLAAMILLLVYAIERIKGGRLGPDRAFSAALIGWSFLYMMTAAMRLAAPAFTFGLAAVNVVQETDQREQLWDR